MTDEPLWLKITFPVNKPDEFSYQGTFKEEVLPDILFEFLRSQIGAGADDKPPNIKEIYTIRLDLDLSDDTFQVSSDCGNKGLRDGILMVVGKKLYDRSRLNADS